MANLTCNASAEIETFNVTKTPEGERNINASIRLYDAAGKRVDAFAFHVSCKQPKSSTKSAESFLEDHLVSSGAFTK